MSTDVGHHVSRVKLQDFNPDGFDRGAGKIKETVWYLVKMFFFLTAFPFPNKLKCFLLRAFGAKVGQGVIIKPRVNVHFPWKLVIGDHVWIGEEALLLNFEQLYIGSNACISQRSFLCGGNHNYKDPAMPYRNDKITVNEGAWVGAGCFVAPGVNIGIDAVVSAGSVVVSDLLNNGIYKGNPAVFVKERWS